MKLGFTTMATPELTGVEAIRVATKYHYESVSIRLYNSNGEVKSHSTPAHVLQIRDAYISENIIPGALMCYNPRLTADDKSKEALRDYMRFSLEMASLIGAKNIRLFGDVYSPLNFAEIAANSIQEFDNKIGIIIQNHKGWADDSGVLEIISHANSPHIGLLFSPDHCKPHEVIAVCKQVKPFIKEVYVANKLPQKAGEDKAKHALIDQGVFDWNAIYNELNLSHFDGIVSVKWEKVHNPELADYSVVLPYAKNWFDKKHLKDKSK
ncbi:MAG: sugar phosphate isomerase/epimerase [Firmicutes bacterium]|nr:sugar phosphate isomerase/epimerase [Bacillota bacterium]